MKETTTNIRFGKVAKAVLIAARSKSQRIVFGSFPAESMWFRISEKNLCYPCFTTQQPKNTGNRFAFISSMNGIQLEKYLSASAESTITLPLPRFRKKLDSLICTKY